MSADRRQRAAARRLAAAVAARPTGPTGPDVLGQLFAPQPLVRLEVIRILVPLAILAFLSDRLLHAPDWLSDAGFVVPDLGGDSRQPLPLPAIPPWAAWSVAAALLAAGLATAAGAWTRASSGVFAALLFYVAFADRLASFTVSKIGPVLVLAIALGPAGTRWSVDAWRRRRRDPAHAPPRLASGGTVRFFQLYLAVFYFSSGVCKARHAWLVHYDPLVLWTQLHDSYQTPVSWLLANHVPAFGWTVLQWLTLVFELGAPLWYALRWTRPVALAWAIAMHAMIALMFGPVAPFGALMIALNVAAFAPAPWLERALTPRAWRRGGPRPDGDGATPAIRSGTPPDRR